MTDAITLHLAATWQTDAARVFAAQLAELGIALPVTTKANEPGVIFGANGRDLATIDSNGNIDDATAGLLAGYVTLAINMAGGFPPSRTTLSTELDAMLRDWKARADQDREHAPSLVELVERAKAKVAAMSPEERKAMQDAQRESFVRAMTTPCEHGVLDWETCPQCRAGGDHV